MVLAARGSGLGQELIIARQKSGGARRSSNLNTGLQWRGCPHRPKFFSRDTREGDLADVLLTTPALRVRSPVSASRGRGGCAKFGSTKTVGCACPGAVGGVQCDPIEKKRSSRLSRCAARFGPGRDPPRARCNWVTSQALRDRRGRAADRRLTRCDGSRRSARRARRRQHLHEPLITSEWAVAVFTLRAAGLATDRSNGNGTPQVSTCGRGSIWTRST
jgi:hypothetical protein